MGGFSVCRELLGLQQSCLLQLSLGWWLQAALQLPAAAGTAASAARHSGFRGWLAAPGRWVAAPQLVAAAQPAATSTGSISACSRPLAAADSQSPIAFIKTLFDRCPSHSP
jgi:hypothetical protein